MRMRLVAVMVLGLGTSILSATLLAATPDGFDARVEALRNRTGVPGMAIAIVENGQVTLAKGYGVRKLGSTTAVDAHTIFPTGSTGKAFTVAALGILVDQGRIGWDDKVIDHLPGFQMYDPWVTREMTIRDLLVHRSGLGLGAGDLLFVPRSNLGRAEAVKRLRHIKPASSFRSGYAYDNILYMVAGQLIEAVTGQTWEAFTADHVLKPAGMLDSTADDGPRFETTNRAQPHARLNGGLPRSAGARRPRRPRAFLQPDRPSGPPPLARRRRHRRDDQGPRRLPLLPAHLDRPRHRGRPRVGPSPRPPRGFRAPPLRIPRPSAPRALGADDHVTPRPVALPLPPPYPHATPKRTRRDRHGNAGPRRPPRLHRIENQDLTPGSGLRSTLCDGQTSARSASSTAPFTSGTL